jgi:succinyl-CoA synthetase beta subunit
MKPNGRSKPIRSRAIKLFEFQARDLLTRYGLAVPEGLVASSEKEAEAAAKTLGGTVVVKAQALSGGRGKAGGVRLAASAASAGKAAHDIFALTIGGEPVKRVLVAAALRIEREYYMAVTVDRSGKCVRCILSAAGGIDIEIVAKETPEKIKSFPLPPFSELHAFDPTPAIACILGTGDHTAEAVKALMAMIRLFHEQDCSLVEVNPYVVTKEGGLFAADAKIVIDDNALFKHPDLETLRNAEEYSDDERSARAAGLSFVGLDGSIGCMVNGAGLAMATMDLIALFGAKPANFLDVGGSSNPQKVLDAFSILLANKNITVILVNIFGGITRCDDIARGIIMAKQKLGIAKPMVVRLIGTNADRGRELLAEAGITALSDLIAAIRQAVALEGRAP